MFDWEMSTIGDPLIDLGIALDYWRDRTDPPDLLDLSQGHAHTIRAGIPDPRRVGRALRQADRPRHEPYRFLSRMGAWKTATVVEQIYARFARGQTSDPRFAPMGNQAPALARGAAMVASQLGFRE